MFIFCLSQVRDGGSSSSPLIGTYCGPQIPNPLSTSANYMYLKFVTDASVHNLGFEAGYVSDEGGCGGPLTDDTGTLQSPGHPNVYPHGVNCTWNIRVEPGLIIRLTFLTFNIENHVNCNYDSVGVYDNSSAVESSLVGRFVTIYYTDVLLIRPHLRLTKSYKYNDLVFIGRLKLRTYRPFGLKTGGVNSRLVLILNGLINGI